MAKSKSKLRTHDARLAIIEDTVIKPPAPDIPADAVAFAASLDFIADDWQTELLRSSKKRIHVLAGRQTGKTAITTLKALHASLTNSDFLTIILSPSERQSKITFQALLRHYAAAGMPCFKASTALTLDLTNGSQIIALPASEGKTRGYASVDLLLVDEAAQCSDALYFSCMPFVAVSDGSIILISTPFGQRGFFYEIAANASPEWLRFKIPSSECKRISPEFLKKSREEMGEYWFNSEYNVEFLAPEAGLFSPDSIRAIFDNTLVEYDI
jgi:Terminase large subunit, T4likevirus-type, N-terminal